MSFTGAFKDSVEWNKFAIWCDGLGVKFDHTKSKYIYLNESLTLSELIDKYKQSKQK